MTVSVFAAHTVSLCALSLAFQPLAFPTFLPFSLFMQTDLRLFEPELCSRCFEWHDLNLVPYF